MRFKEGDGLPFIAVIIAICVIVGHLLFGYVFPTVASIIIALSFITVYMMKKVWLTVSWVIMIIGSFAVVDYLTYNSEGISAILYKYMLSIALAQLYGILLCVACSISKRKAYNNTVICNDKKIEKIKATLSVYNFYVIPANIICTMNAIYCAVKSEDSFRLMYLNSGMVVVIVLIAIHVITYTDTMTLVRAIKKNCKEEGSEHEVFKESDND